jgi:hypothetical protein
MADISRDSKIDQGYIDGRDPKVSGPSPKKTYLGEWTTSRRELWCFYLYYVVRFLFAVFSTCFLMSSKGKQWTLRLQFRPVPIPKSSLPCRLRPEPTTIHQTMRQRDRLRAILPGSHPQRSVFLFYPSSSAALALLTNGPSLFISFATYSQYDYSPHKWDQLCHSGNFAADDWRLGGLWDVEVRMN